jgi:hypothetical protein
MLERAFLFSPPSSAPVRVATAFRMRFLLVTDRGNNTLLLHTTLLDFRTVALTNLGYMRGDIVTWGVAVWGIRNYA